MIKRSLILFIGLELLYIAAVRYVVFWGGFGELEQELWWSTIRLGSLVVLWVLFRNLLPAKQERRGVAWYYLLAGAVLCVVPFLVANWGYKYPLNWIFAATSFVVGFREELAYRVVLQTLLTRRIGFWLALGVSNVAFLFYHYGVQPFTLTSMLGLATFGLVMGLFYRLTGSFLLVALIHSIFDAITCFGPFLAEPLSGAWAVLITLMVLIFLILEVVMKPHADD